MVQFNEKEEKWMQRALALARVAQQRGEVPVGAVLVRNGEVIGEGFNSPISDSDPTAHAEMKAIREAAKRIGNYRLGEATLYVTLEPCAMCAGAIVTARIERLVFAARDIRFGAVRSKFKLADNDLLNHQTKVAEGLRAAEAATLLQRFFETKRIMK